LQLNLLEKGIQTVITRNTPTSSPIPQVQASAVHIENNEFKPNRIIIEKVGIDLPVVSVPLVNGTWVVNPQVANYAEGTSLVNSSHGNVGIFAHDRLDGFNKIKQLLTGHDIMIFGNNSRAIYQVTSASVIAPTAVDVFYPTKEPTLTLITCDGILSEKRYMIKAKLIKIEKIK